MHAFRRRPLGLCCHRRSASHVSQSTSAPDITKRDTRADSSIPAVRSPRNRGDTSSIQFQLLQQLDGVTYVRCESGWHQDGRPITLYPLIGRLDAALANRLAIEDKEAWDPIELLNRAWFARALGQSRRTEQLLGGQSTHFDSPVGPPEMISTRPKVRWSAPLRCCAVSFATNMIRWPH